MRQDSRLAVVLVVGISLVASQASAQTVYKWIDDNGEVHYSHAVPPERVDDAHERLAADGRITDRIERAPTHEERERLAEELARERDEAERRKLQASRDRLLLAAYPSERHLRRSMQAELESLEAERGTLSASLESTRRYLGKLLEHAAAFERNGEPVPDRLAEPILTSRQRFLRLMAAIERLDRRIEEVEALYLEDLERFRQLTVEQTG